MQLNFKNHRHATHYLRSSLSIVLGSATRQCPLFMVVQKLQSVNHLVQKGYGHWHCCKIMSRSNRLIPFSLQRTVAPSFACHLLLHYNIYFFLLWHTLGYSVIIAFNRGIINNSNAIIQQLLIGFCVFNIVKNIQNDDFIQV